MGYPSRIGTRRFCVIALATLIVSACGNLPNRVPSSSGTPHEGFPVTVAASNGEVSIAQRPRRIVSLSPTATEILYGIGAGSQVIAVDDESTYPPTAPRTGLSGFNPNVEAIADYRPDLVIYAIEPGDLGRVLETIGVPGIMQPPARLLDDTYAQILQLGDATGHRREAESLAEGMKAQISQTVRSLPSFPRSPTYYHELDESYFTATSNTFIGEVYGLLGLTNIADSADSLGNGYPQLSGEYIIRANPDLIFLANARCCGQSAETVAARPGWDTIDAVQNDGVIELDDDVASRWGPRIVELLQSVARRLQSFQPQLQ